jgi:hypothetical protein
VKAKKKEAGRARGSARSALQQAVSASFAFAVERTISADKFAADQLAGKPTVDLLRAMQNAGDDFHLLSGFMSAGGVSVPVTGTMPEDVRKWLDSQKRKAGRPLEEAKKIAMLLSIQNYRAQGHGKKKSRMLAAAAMKLVKDERDVRRTESEATKLDALRGFNQFIVFHNRVVLFKHKDAIFNVLDDGMRIGGLFWRVFIGKTIAELVEGEPRFISFVKGGGNAAQLFPRPIRNNR